MPPLPITKELRHLADPQLAIKAQRFFKSGPGEYGEGDRFLGIRVPVLRALAKKWTQLPLKNALTLLQSSWHEERLTALFILVAHYKRGTPKEKNAVYKAYMLHRTHVNNWDLVDSSAHLIVGPWLEDKDRSPLYKLAVSDSLWDRRIAILATFHYIRQQDFDDTLALAHILLQDQEDLIHKAVGWMLRETGNRNKAKECHFLNQHATTMPRTMLRYAIEKFPTNERKKYLSMKRV